MDLDLLARVRAVPPMVMDLLAGGGKVLRLVPPMDLLTKGGCRWRLVPPMDVDLLARLRLVPPMVMDLLARGEGVAAGSPDQCG